MPLTPDDVSNKRFTPVRLREGYDMGEVDQFLDEVEAELARLLKENEDLRERARVASDHPPLAASPVAEPSPDSGRLQSENDQLREQLRAAEDRASHAQAQAAQAAAATPAASFAAPAAAAPAAPQEIRVTTVADASTAAARLLEIATNNADQMVQDARNEADQIVGQARVQAERLESEVKTRTDQVEAEARTRSQRLDSETAERRQQLFGDMEKEKGRLNTEIENLRAFEREYRSRLKSYFSQQLQALETTEGGSSPVAGVASSSYQPSSSAPASTSSYESSEPKRLRSLLGDEEY